MIQFILIILILLGIKMKVNYLERRLYRLKTSNIIKKDDVNYNKEEKLNMKKKIKRKKRGE
uniref:Uncharacterized protein n=1 Tax=Geladintestivirus 2 TaxID=3233134 RepID=A0AAU8ML20_9CAUD